MYNLIKLRSAYFIAVTLVIFLMYSVTNAEEMHGGSFLLSGGMTAITSDGGSSTGGNYSSVPSANPIAGNASGGNYSVNNGRNINDPIISGGGASVINSSSDPQLVDVSTTIDGNNVIIVATFSQPVEANITYEHGNINPINTAFTDYSTVQTFILEGLDPDSLYKFSINTNKSKEFNTKESHTFGKFEFVTVPNIDGDVTNQEFFITPSDYSKQMFKYPIFIDDDTGRIGGASPNTYAPIMHSYKSPSNKDKFDFVAVYGVIKDMNGNRLDDVTVSLMSFSDGAPDKIVNSKTENGGKYAIMVPKNANYLLFVNSDIYQPFSRTLSIAEDSIGVNIFLDKKIQEAQVINTTTKCKETRSIPIALAIFSFIIMSLYVFFKVYLNKPSDVYSILKNTSSEIINWNAFYVIATTVTLLNIVLYVYWCDIAGVLI